MYPPMRLCIDATFAAQSKRSKTVAETILPKVHDQFRFDMTTLFDAGDIQRLDRERTLTEQAPRALPEEDRSPVEEPMQDEPENPFDILLDGILSALKDRL